MQWAWGPVSVHRATQRTQSIRYGPRLPSIRGEIATPTLLLQNSALWMRQNPQPGASLFSVASQTNFRLILRS